MSAGSPSGRRSAASCCRWSAAPRLAVAFGLPLYWEGIFVGTILTATSVSISAQTLLELGALRTREGSTILRRAVIDDVMGIVVLSVVVALAKASRLARSTGWALAIVVVRLVVFFVVAVCARSLAAGRSAMGVATRRQPGGAGGGAGHHVRLCVGGGVCRRRRRHHRRLPGGRPHRADRVQAGHRSRHSSADLLDVRADVLHQHRPRGQRPRARDRAPFTTVLCWWRSSPRRSAAACSRAVRLHRGNRCASAIGMISRGEVGLIVAGYGLANGLIGRDVFSASVIMVLATTMVTPPLMRLVFPPHAFGHVMVEETMAGPPPEPQPEWRSAAFERRAIAPQSVIHRGQGRAVSSIQAPGPANQAG